MRKTVEWWAGIGGQMAVEVRKRAVRRKAKEVGTVKKAKTLNKAALKLVDENAAAIAQSLLDSTIHGNVVSARLLRAGGEHDDGSGDGVSGERASWVGDTGGELAGVYDGERGWRWRRIARR
jgi:hypothetical protein